MGIFIIIYIHTKYDVFTFGTFVEEGAISPRYF